MIFNQKMYDDNYNASEENIIAIVNSLNSPIIPSNFKFIFNKIFFISLFNYDVNTIIKSINSSTKKWDKILYCRLLAISIYEFLNDVFEIFGKEYQGTIIEILGDNYDFSEIFSIKRKLNKFKKLNCEYFKRIRHNTIGHRDHNALDQYNLIMKIDPIWFKRKGVEIIKINTLLIKYFSKLLNDFNNHQTA